MGEKGGKGADHPRGRSRTASAEGDGQRAQINIYLMAQVKEDDMANVRPLSSCSLGLNVICLQTDQPRYLTRFHGSVISTLTPAKPVNFEILPRLVI